MNTTPSLPAEGPLNAVARDYERLARSLEGMHWLAVLGLLLGAALRI